MSREEIWKRLAVGYVNKKECFSCKKKTYNTIAIRKYYDDYEGNELWERYVVRIATYHLCQKCFMEVNND